MKQENSIIVETEKWALVKNNEYDSYEVCYKPKLRKSTSEIKGVKVNFEETPVKLYNSSFGAYAFSYSSLKQFTNSFFGRNRKRFENISSVNDINDFEKKYNEYLQ